MRIAKTRKVNVKFKLIMLGIFLFHVPIVGPMALTHEIECKYNTNSDIINKICTILILLQLVYLGIFLYILRR